MCGEDRVLFGLLLFRYGSPPHVWGRRLTNRLDSRPTRFTPTCVGKTGATRARVATTSGSPPHVWGRRFFSGMIQFINTVHPHMCGEDESGLKNNKTRTGSPPHVWGRLRKRDQSPVLSRFTPTCVGKTALACEYLRLPCGSPPHVWGRRGWSVYSARRGRFTPTCVGKTGHRSREPQKTPVHPHMCGEDVLEIPDLPRGNGSPPHVWGRLPSLSDKPGKRAVHPHMCGEDYHGYTVGASGYGSPPHVWGRRALETNGSHCIRFTPTCVGKTFGQTKEECLQTVHPHMCGEDVTLGGQLQANTGSPPHVWGRRPPRNTRKRQPRFTPTCVGKTRMVAMKPVFPFGSPPHVWGRRFGSWLRSFLVRFTPTCVGKTSAPSSTHRAAPVHPHMCGEDSSTSRLVPSLCGSPPHVWGRRQIFFMIWKYVRFTPTCVGKTYYLNVLALLAPVHPHMCGEDQRGLPGWSAGGGSPPHVWGRLALRGYGAPLPRFTPTCVGKTRA